MHKKLTRSCTNNILGGVCRGLGEYFNIDPVIFRILFLVLLFVFGSGVLLYLIMWIIIPQQQLTFNEPVNNTEPKKTTDSDLLAGITLICLGTIFLLRYFVSWISFSKLWPILLIAFGIFMIIRYFIQLNNNNNEKK